jgi:hypothetical protein
LEKFYQRNILNTLSEKKMFNHSNNSLMINLL